MVEDTPKSDNHQELKGYFKSTGEMLFFGLVVTLILLYRFTKYLAIKSLIFLKGLADNALLPLSLTLAVFLGLIPEKFAIILTLLISCILTYLISPKLMKPLFGDFGELKWVRIIVVALTCVYLYFFWLMVTSTSDYVAPQIICYRILVFWLFFIFLSSIPIGKMMQANSDMLQWEGSVPTLYTFVLPVDAEEKDKEEIIREYKRQSDDPWIARKITRCAPAYTSGLIFSVVCMLLGLLFVVFLQLNILLAMLLIVWLMKDLYYLMRKKSLFKLEDLKNVFVGRHNPEKWIISSLLPFKRHAFIKHFFVLICILVGFFIAIGMCIMLFTTFLPCISKSLIIRTTYNNIRDFLELFTGLAYVLTVVLANIFQLNFWYILMKRFPHFLVIWTEKDFSMDVDAPKLPTGGVPIFLVNSVIIAFLFTFLLVPLMVWINHYLNVSANTLMWKMSILFIYILLLAFEVYITYSTSKNRGVRETNPNNLYKDNKRLPLAVVIQLFSLVLLYIYGIIYAFQGSDAISEALHILLVLFIGSCLLIQCFYMEDMLLYLREQDSERQGKRKIKEEIPFFISAFMLFILTYSIDYCWGTKSVYLGIFAIIMVAIGFTLVTICDNSKTPTIKKPPEK